MQLADTAEAVAPDSWDLARMVQETFENLDPQGIEQLRGIYADDVSFEDPIHGIQGLDALVENFQNLYTNVESCQFKFHRSVVNTKSMFFSWTMILKHKKLRRGKIIRVEGSSYIKYRQGKVYYHRDYFDLGAMVYENIPVLGGLIKFIRKRMSR